LRIHRGNSKGSRPKSSRGEGREKKPWGRRPYQKGKEWVGPPTEKIGDARGLFFRQGGRLRGEKGIGGRISNDKRLDVLPWKRANDLRRHDSTGREDRMQKR